MDTTLAILLDLDLHAGGDDRVRRVVGTADAKRIDGGRGSGRA